jgi:alkyl hydroperoxide reductase subunit F
VSIKGDQFVKGLVYKDRTTGEEKEIQAEGVFVEIGLLPSTGPVKDLVKMNEIGQIITDPRTGQTSVQGIWAAGDATDGLYHQNNIAAGDAVRALEDIYMHLHAR